MSWVDVLGSTAGALTTIAFVPQVIKTWKCKSAEDISMGMFLLFSGGVLCWLLYGVALDSLPMIIANATTLILALTVIVMKIYFAVLNKRRLQDAANRGL